MLILSAAPLQAAEKKTSTFAVAGLVTDSVGMPVPELPVRVFSSAGVLPRDPRLGLKQSRRLASGKTASDGTYRLVVPLSPGNRRYYLSFYASDGFDGVRFARPDRIDITSRVKPGGAYLLDFRLTFHGGWAKVQKTLKAHPPNSAKARVIRRYGIAEEIHKSKNKTPEIWWYYSKGKRFEFLKGKMVGEKNFSPIFK